MSSSQASPLPSNSAPVPLITDLSGFRDLIRRLEAEPLIALDTEAASFHRYRDRVYLLQLSSRSDTYLVDPLAVPDLPGLGELLANPEIEVIFHDADYDLRLLQREFGFRASRLFDTRIAAQFLNEPGIGLAALLEKYFGVKLDKRFQRADWSARPISPPMLSYAAEDTRSLPALRDLMREALEKRGRLSWVEEECDLLTRVRWPDPVPPEVAALAAKGTRTLKPRPLAVFREVYVWRDRTAGAMDRAPFRVMGTDVIFSLAERQPKTSAELSTIPGVGRDTLDRRGPEILAAVRRGLEVPEAALPRFERSPRYRPDPAFDGRLERLKTARSALATRLDLLPGVLAPNWMLEAIARAVPANPEELSRIEGVRRWQVENAGDELLAALALPNT
jgi:ribonuclease D